ncbi:glycosyltransferase family 2 protein [Candidatus Saccharibacteria bacterium]|nr:glycosyltransferase family 2 protein [Candidatus Saccharibacteria bacterium]
MTISIVIPVYNEEKHIGACLQSIAAQTRRPDEVIVVDNNCTDRTVEFAKQFDFVRVIQQAQQGRGHARNAGFNAASSDIIGRIDVDSRLDKHWVERVLKHFRDDAELAGLTGLGKTAFFPFINTPKSTLFSRSYYWFVHTQFRAVTMWGATMAVKKSAWESVKDQVSTDDSIVHEDQDLSLWIAASGGKILQTNDVLITTNGQEYRFLPKLLHYNKLFHSTRSLHVQNGNLAKITNKLSAVPLMPGFVLSLVLGGMLILTSAILFPLDYVLIRSKLLNNRLS